MQDFFKLFHLNLTGVHVSIEIIFCYWCKEVYFVLLLCFQPFSAIFQLDKKIETLNISGKSTVKEIPPLQTKFELFLYLNSWTNSVYKAHTEHCCEWAPVCHLRMWSVLRWCHCNLVQRTNRTDREPEIQL